MDWLNGIILSLLASKILIACPVSKTTLTYVQFCPKTLGEWRIRAEIKKCSHVRQNCTTPQNFVYHCVLNNFANATLEVCAQETFIIGNRHDKREKGVDEDKPLLSYEGAQRKKDVISYKQCKNKETGPFVISIDIGEKYYGLAYTDLSDPQKIIPSHPMERIAVLVEKPNKILKVGKDATKEFIEMKADDLLNHVYVNEIKSNELWKEVPEAELQYITLFTEATLGVIERIENEIGQKMRGMEDVKIVFSAECHWQESFKDLREDLLKKSRTLFNWQKGHEKVAFIEKVRTVTQVICEAETTSYCLNYNVENVKIKSKYYAVLNAGFGSCHFSFLHNRDEKHLDVREAEGTIRRDWEEALPEDHVWALCQEMIEEKYINQQNHVRVINQYENLHERILMCRYDETTFQFSFPSQIFKKDFKSHSL